MGDRVLFYHSGKERAIVGEMRVLKASLSDPTGEDPKWVAVQVKAVRRWPNPVTLDRIKDDPLLKTWDLVRLPRLSVTAVSPEQLQRLEELALAMALVGSFSFILSPVRVVAWR